MFEHLDQLFLACKRGSAAEIVQLLTACDAFELSLFYPGHPTLHDCVCALVDHGHWNTMMMTYDHKVWQPMFNIFLYERIRYQPNARFMASSLHTVLHGKVNPILNDLCLTLCIDASFDARKQLLTIMETIPLESQKHMTNEALLWTWLTSQENSTVTSGLPLVQYLWTRTDSVKFKKMLDAIKNSDAKKCANDSEPRTILENRSGAASSSEKSNTFSS